MEGRGCPAPSPAAHRPEGTGRKGTGRPLVLSLCSEEGSTRHLLHGKCQKQKTGSHTLPLLRNSTTGRTRVKKANQWWPEPRRVGRGPRGAWESSRSGSGRKAVHCGQNSSDWCILSSGKLPKPALETGAFLLQTSVLPTPK